MASYVVMEPGAGRGETRFVCDGFTFLGLLFPVIWLLWHRLWIEALVALAALLCIGIAGELSGWTVTAMALSFLASLYVGLDGAALRLWALRRRGWRETAIVEANNEDEAMIRYFADGGHVPDPGKPAAPPQSYVAATPATTGPALGLLSYPARR